MFSTIWIVPQTWARTSGLDQTVASEAVDTRLPNPAANTITAIRSQRRPAIGLLLRLHGITIRIDDARPIKRAPRASKDKLTKTTLHVIRSYRTCSLGDTHLLTAGTMKRKRTILTTATSDMRTAASWVFQWKRTVTYWRRTFNVAGLRLLI